MKKRISMAALCLVLALFLLAGCANTGGQQPAPTPGAAEPTPAEPAGKFTPGTYTASAPGMNGDVTVEVTFSADAIESVAVQAHNETAGISDRALETLPGAIQENQSLGVEAVSGATMTSNAILAAVEDCVVQAGGDPETMKEPVATLPVDAALEADVVVVGAGIAGLSAAVEAAENGAKVVLVEKMASTGGATMISGGQLLAAGTEMQKEEGIEDSWEALAEFFLSVGEGKVANEGMVRTIAQMSADNILWLEGNGVEFMRPMQIPRSVSLLNMIKRTHNPANDSGSGLVFPLTESAIAKGVTVLTNSPATGLLTKDGAVVGIEGTTSTGGKLTVQAKSVILATGGYDSNGELMEQYSPQIGYLRAFVGEAHMGDGLVWARELGSPIIGGESGIILSRENYTDTTGTGDPQGELPYVDTTGKRFMNEAAYQFVRTRTLLDMPGMEYFVIADQKAADVGAKLDAALEKGVGFQAETLAELAALIGCDAKTLEETIAQYNKDCAAGKDSLFDKDAAKLTPIDTAPYYAVNYKISIITGSFGGPTIDDSCRVLGADGSPIPGLYAAGEVANGELFHKSYPSSGTAIQFYCSMGRIAGKDAAQAK